MKKFLLAAAILALSGCVTDQGNYTVLSNKIVNVKDFDLSKADRVRHVKGVDRSHQILWFTTKTNPNLSGALSDAFEKADGDVMTDVTVSTWGWTTILYGQSGWTVEGDVVKTRNK